MFNKMGNWHIEQLAKDCVSSILVKQKSLKYENDGKTSFEGTLDWIIEDGGYIVNDKPGKDIKTKFSELLEYYIVCKLSRELDIMGGDMELIKKESSKYWAVLKESNFI